MKLLLSLGNSCHVSFQFIIGWTYSIIWTTCHSFIYWFETRPLVGQNVLLTPSYVNMLNVSLSIHIIQCRVLIWWSLFLWLGLKGCLILSTLLFALTSKFLYERTLPIYLRRLIVGHNWGVSNYTIWIKLVKRKYKST